MIPVGIVSWHPPDGPGRALISIRFLSQVARESAHRDRKKKPSIYIDEQAERAAKERLAGVLAFPKTAPHFAKLAEKQKTGTLYEMPSHARIAARQSLRILPVGDAG